MQKVVVKVIHQLYEDDILSEDVILSWHGAQLDDEEVDAINIRKRV